MSEFERAAQCLLCCVCRTPHAAFACAQSENGNWQRRRAGRGQPTNPRCGLLESREGIPESLFACFVVDVDDNSAHFAFQTSDEIAATASRTTNFKPYGIARRRTRRPTHHPPQMARQHYIASIRLFVFFLPARLPLLSARVTLLSILNTLPLSGSRNANPTSRVNRGYPSKNKTKQRSAQAGAGEIRRRLCR